MNIKVTKKLGLEEPQAEKNPSKVKAGPLARQISDLFHKEVRNLPNPANLNKKKFTQFELPLRTPGGG